MLCGSKSQALVENVESGDKIEYSKATMNKNQSKRVGVVFVVLILIGLVYFGWYLLKSDTNPNIKTTNSTTTKKSTSTTTTTPTKTDDNSAAPTQTADLLSFSKDGFNFTFKYPKDWTISSSTNTPFDGNPDITQKTVKIKTDTGVEFSFDNPSTAIPSTGYDLKNAKDITASTLTFNRNYGKNSSGQTLYAATYIDPNNFDAASVSFNGNGTIDATTISDLDNIVSSFKFVQ